MPVTSMQYPLTGGAPYVHLDSTVRSSTESHGKKVTRVIHTHFDKFTRVCLLPMAYPNSFSANPWGNLQFIFLDPCPESDMIQTILTEDVQKSMIPGVREGQMEANETPERKAARREQNREAQKNFRARQAARVKYIEEEVVRYQKEYQALQKASTDKTQEIKDLNAYVEQLSSEIKSLKSSLGLSIVDKAVPENCEGLDVFLDRSPLETLENYSFEEFSLF
ncbi:hypothetical protein H2198_010328 [Neophaeococcomyces mojaviensis]|uniref:Uncharacterized protein n=1 Tax=Neophaeococcomyces mojaviensis TaxID=3383035 RepID=A0ACC2ZRZ1_9EURO|nr:hypothetical protein H2198_010328 [Knufia sp. JES_112]